MLDSNPLLHESQEREGTKTKGIMNTRAVRCKFFDHQRTIGFDIILERYKSRVFLGVLVSHYDLASGILQNLNHTINL